MYVKLGLSDPKFALYSGFKLCRIEWFDLGRLRQVSFVSV